MKKISPGIVPRSSGRVKLRRTIEIEVPEGTSLFEAETMMQKALMEAGSGMVQELLTGGDADGEPLVHEGRTFTAKSEKEPLIVESSFGAVTISRWAYQSSSGGVCYYPLDRKMELVGSATPKFARSVGFKHSQAPAGRVCQDLEENHSRSVSVHFVQAITGLLGELAQSAQPEPDSRQMPDPGEVATIAVGIDGACVHITTAPEPAAEGQSSNPPDLRKGRTREWRTAMVGTIAFYNKSGERLGTIYTGCAPPENSDDGKEDFWFLMERDLAVIKARYQNACYVGISDGARDYVPWLQRNTSTLMLDFCHAAGYLGGAAGAMVAKGAGYTQRKAQWLAQTCHNLKHDDGAALRIHEEMKARAELPECQSEAAVEKLHKAITYFSNNIDRMNYAAGLRRHQPIASGVTEAACGLIIKDRLCGRGMRWSIRMAQHIITLRSMIASTGNVWENFWKKMFPGSIT